MNARQKAKKYKKQMEIYKADAMAFRKQAARESSESFLIKRRIRDLQIAQIIPNYPEMPSYAENRARELIALKFGEFLIDNNLVLFHISDALGLAGEDNKKITAYLTVLEPNLERGTL